VYRLLDYPDYWARCAEDKAFCAATVEELLRDSTIATGFRTVTEDFVYEDILFPKGTLLIIHAPYSGRDPTVFDDATTIRPDRDKSNRHLAFGRGAHMCLGQHLARAQIEEGIHLIARRIPHPKLVGEVHWRPALGITGLVNLPIEVKPAAVAA
jgi:cytochrome P450